MDPKIGFLPGRGRKWNMMHFALARKSAKARLKFNEVFVFEFLKSIDRPCSGNA